MPTRKNVDSITRVNSISNTPISGGGGLKSLTLKPRFKKSFYHKLTSLCLVFVLLFQIITPGLFLVRNAQADSNTYFSDPFTGTTVDTSKWVKVDSLGGITQNDALNILGDNDWANPGLKTLNTFDRSSGDLVIEADMTSPDCSAAVASGSLGYGSMNYPTENSYMVIQSSGVVRLFYVVGDGTAYDRETDFSCTNNVPFHMKLVILRAGGANLYINNAFAPSASLTGGTFTNQQIFLSSRSTNGVTYDNFTVYRNPDVPTNLQAVQGENQITLNWEDADSSVIDYVIEYREAGTTTFSVFNDGISTNRFATITGLTNGKNYDFRVSAANIARTGLASYVVSNTPVLLIPSVPMATSVGIYGSISVGEKLGGKYNFVDSNGDNEATSTFRWLRADSASGEYQPIPGATSNTYVLTGNDLGKYIKFEVTPISLVAPVAGAAVLSLSTAQVNSASYFNHILSTGQSLANGAIGSPALTTTQPYQNKMLDGASLLVPLVESDVETIGSSMANFITSYSTGGYQIAVTKHGVGGALYSGLKKGSTPFANGMSQVSAINAAVSGLNTYRAIGVTVIHGESDSAAGATSDQYEGYLKEWQKDYQADIQTLTGQTTAIPLFTDQMSSFAGGSGSAAIPCAQLSASENNPDNIVLVGPKYFLTYSDGVHLTNSSYRQLGEYYGKVIKKVAVDKEEWKPLSPKQIYRIGNEIYAKFNVPAGPIQFDTSLVLAKQNYGFEYYDAISSASISSVSIVSPDTVKITLNTSPTGSNQRLRYAFTGVAGSWAGADQAGSARGNLRDSDDTVSQYGNTLYNWAVHFDKSIEDNTNPSVFSLSNALTGDSTSNRKPTFYWNNSDDSISGLSKYQLFVDGALNMDNINSVSTSVSVNTELSCGKHSWYVKAFDNAGNSIKSYDTLDLEINCGGGFVAPSKPSISNLDITNNNGTLSLNNLPATITQIAISTSPDFTDASWEDIAKKDELLKQYANTDKLYIKFRTQEGGVSDTIIKEGNNIIGNEQGTPSDNVNDGNTDTNNSNQSLQDGDLIKTPNNPDIYVIKYKNNKQYKRLLLSPTIFNSYLHLKWNNIKTISQQQLDQYQTSNLVKEATDTVIYTLTSNGDTGKRKPLNPSTSYDPDSIYEINKPERDSYELED